MSATLEQQRKIEQLEARLRALDEAEAADAKRASDVNGYSAFDEMMAIGGSQLIPNRGGDSLIGAPPRAIQEGAIEGVGAVVGGAVGALPVLSLPTGGLSIPIGAALGSMAGNAANQLRRGDGFSRGELAASGVTSLIPAGKMSAIAGKELALEAAKQAGGNIAAKATETVIDRGELPTFNEGAAALAGGLGGTLIGKTVARDARASAEAVRSAQRNYRDEVIKRGMGAGYVFDPVAANPSAATRGTMKLSNPAEFYREASVQNQEVTNRLVRAEIGLPDAADLGNPLTIAKAIADAKEPYRELASLNPTAKSGLEKLQSIRGEARDLWKEYARDAKVDVKKRAMQLDSQAKSLERGLEGLAVRMGRPDLKGGIQAAREKLSKLHYVETVMHPVTGDIDAAMLAKIHDANRGLFSGNLRVIAESASVHPYMFRDASNLRGALTEVGQFSGLSAAYDSTVGEGIRSVQRSGAYQRGAAIPKYNTKVQDPVATFLLRGTQAASR